MSRSARSLSRASAASLAFLPGGFFKRFLQDVEDCDVARPPRSPLAFYAEHEVEIDGRHRRPSKRGRRVADEDGVQPDLLHCTSNVDEERLRVHERSIASQSDTSRTLWGGWVQERVRVLMTNITTEHTKGKSCLLLGLKLCVLSVLGGQLLVGLTWDYTGPGSSEKTVSSGASVGLSKNRL